VVTLPLLCLQTVKVVIKPLEVFRRIYSAGKAAIDRSASPSQQAHKTTGVCTLNRQEKDMLLQGGCRCCVAPRVKSVAEGVGVSSDTKTATRVELFLCLALWKFMARRWKSCHQHIQF
jgi:hypothetical protein